MGRFDNCQKNAYIRASKRNWHMKKLLLLVILLSVFTSVFAQEPVALTIRDTSGPVVSRNIYGHFSEDLGRCIYDGFWAGDHIRMDVVEALRKIKVPVLRWPGGCYADQYHWADAIGPRNQRKRTGNTRWGMGGGDNSL